jgi:ubiquitin carboxyl-terminal hydrolase 35/38
MFGIESKTGYKCKTCSDESYVNETLFDVPVSIPESRPLPSIHNHADRERDIKYLLELYFREGELLDGYYCIKCNKEVQAIKSSEIVTYPQYLVITLMRFKYNPSINSHAKNCDKIKILQQLQMSNEHYRLNGYIVHSGSSIHSGHYYCWAHDDSDQWFKFNDSNVSPPQKPDWGNGYSTPYVIVYKKTNDMAKV